MPFDYFFIYGLLEDRGTDGLIKIFVLFLCYMIDFKRTLVSSCDIDQKIKQQQHRVSESDLCPVFSSTIQFISSFQRECYSLVSIASCSNEN